MLMLLCINLVSSNIYCNNSYRPHTLINFGHLPSQNIFDNFQDYDIDEVNLFFKETLKAETISFWNHKDHKKIKKRKKHHFQTIYNFSTKIINNLFELATAIYEEELIQISQLAGEDDSLTKQMLRQELKNLYFAYTDKISNIQEILRCKLEEERDYTQEKNYLKYIKTSLFENIELE